MDNFGLDGVQWSDVKAVSVGSPRPYDAEVEYLESTGTQYVDSGIDAAMDVRMSIDAVSLNSGSTQFHAMGIFTNSSVSSYALFCSSQGMIQAAVGGSSNRVSANGINWNTRHTVELDCGKLMVDSVSYGFPPTVPTSLETPSRIYVCGLNGVALHPGRWYGAKIYKNGSLVRDYVPVRKNRIGYFYDKVSHQLFGNQGTGEFLYGGDIVPIEYLESTGTQYIDTDVYFDAGTDSFSLDCGFSGTFQNTRTTVFLNGGDTTAISPRKAAAINFGGNANQSQTVFNWFGVAYADGGTIAKFEQFTLARNLIEYSPGSISDNNTTLQLSVLAGQRNKSMLLCGGRTADGTSVNPFNAYNMRIHSFKIMRSGVAVRDFQPVRIRTEGCLLDKVNWKIYRNDGTGSFICGNDIDDHTVIKLEKGISTKELVWYVCPYVKDGLVAWYDGIWNADILKHDSSATAWTNLITEYRNTPTVPSNVTCSTNCFQLLGGVEMSYFEEEISGLYQLLSTTNGLTVEVVMHPHPSGTTATGIHGRVIVAGTSVYFQTNHSPCQLGFGGSWRNSQVQGYKKTTLTSISAIYPTYPSNHGHELPTGGNVNITDDIGLRAWVDGVKYSMNNLNWTSKAPSGDLLVIGNKSSSTQPQHLAAVDYYSVRVYARKLSDAEVAANHLVDKARFNLPA